MKTYVPKQGELQKKWIVIDADGQVFGRVAVEAARVLRGKHKPQFTPFLDCGDHVVIINASKAKLTGNKAASKMYYHHSGYMGGISGISYNDLMKKHPTRAFMFAVKGMLPHNRLGRKLLTHIRVYAGPTHPHEAQNPQPYPMSK